MTGRVGGTATGGNVRGRTWWNKDGADVILNEIASAAGRPANGRRTPGHRGILSEFVRGRPCAKVAAF